MFKIRIEQPTKWSDNKQEDVDNNRFTTGLETVVSVQPYED